MRTVDAKRVEWQLAEVTSPHLAHPVSVVAAKNIPYSPNANRFQNLKHLPAQDVGNVKAHRHSGRLPPER